MGLLHEDIKQIVAEKVNSMQPSKFQVGTYQDDGSVILDANVEPIPSFALIIPELVRDGVKFYFEGCTNPECTCIPKEYILVEPLKGGDKVVLMQDMGGQKLLVLGRI